MPRQTGPAIKLEEETEMVNIKREEGEVQAPAGQGDCFERGKRRKLNEEDAVMPAAAVRPSPKIIISKEVMTRVRVKRSSSPKVIFLRERITQVRVTRATPQKPSPKIFISREIMSRVREKRAKEMGVSVEELRALDSIRLDMERLHDSIVV